MANEDDTKKQDDGAPQGLDAVRAAMQRKPAADAPPATAKPDEDVDLYDDSEDGSDPKDAELTKLRAALKKANKDAERNRRRAKAAADPDDEEDEEDEKPAKEDRAARLERELWTRDAIEELRDAGCQGDKRRLRRVVKMLDSVHPNDVEDAIDELKEDYPDLFKDEEEEEKPKPRRKRAAPKPGPGGAEQRRESNRRSSLSATSQAMLRQGGF